MKNKIFWGVFFLLAGVVVILNQLQIFLGISLISLLLTIFLIAVFLKSLKDLSFPGMLFSLGFILIIYSKQLGIESLSPWAILITALLGSIGLSMIFGKPHVHCFTKGTVNKMTNDSNNNIDISVSFGESTKYIDSKELENVNISCSFGSAVVYFENAEIKGDSATINLDVSFAGVEFYIPKNWKIENKTNVSLGAVEEKNRNNNVTDKTIVIQGKASFSGVEIIYV